MPGLIARLAEAEAALYPDHEAPYSANVNAHGQGTPLPPDGLRPASSAWCSSAG
jgi:hypothetical protein